MNSIARPVYQQLLDRLNQMTIRGNRHKMAVHLKPHPDQSLTPELSRVTSPQDDTAVAFHILFERNSTNAAWRLMTPLRFTA